LIVLRGGRVVSVQSQKHIGNPKLTTQYRDWGFQRDAYLTDGQLNRILPAAK